MKFKSYFSVLLVALLASAMPAQAWNLNAYIPTLSEKTKKISAIAAGVVFGGFALLKIIKWCRTPKQAKTQSMSKETKAQWEKLEKQFEAQAEKEAYDQVYKMWYSKIVCLDESAINQLLFEVTYQRNVGTLDRVKDSPVMESLQKVDLTHYHSKKKIYAFQADKQDLEIIQKVCNEILKEREHEQILLAQERDAIAHAFDDL